MIIIKLYVYKNCSTCKKAEKFLKEKGIDFTSLPIREMPPSIDELNQMLSHYDGDMKRLFNTSGQDYRALNMKEKLATLSKKEALALLSQNGNLVKRPFLLTQNKGLVGFKQDEWSSIN